MRYLLVLVMLALLFGSQPAYAETYEWDAAGDGVGIPKGVAGADGIACYGEASYQGNTVKLTNYIGADAGLMAEQPNRERAWQQAECQRIMRADIALVFSWRWGVTLPADVPISVRTKAL